MAIRDFLALRRVHFELLLHQPAACATRRAQCLHVPGRSVAKAVLVRAGEHFVLAVLPATHWIDLARLAACLDVPELRLATEDEIAAIFVDCERGALPPFGSAYGLQTVVDSHLAGAAEIVVEGNLRHEGLRVRYRDFEQLEAPLRARFATVHPNDPRPSRRRAG
jgi:Ala-tRNA(Pro) deacylase